MAFWPILKCDMVFLMAIRFGEVESVSVECGWSLRLVVSVRFRRLRSSGSPDT
jgi:hypothetical protein